ncbi:hypothetical protein RclHR1_18950001 [Rhizophagus clarus]|uniref:Uncharacterized protein n=1 Tax=Rhizophagus clarus TaxID=94130 RepID=A0A2Z6QSH4_9GLOM|nr:hypothetical protein RclHR1_18950001 [Rhizophagus clarus]
MFESLHKEFVKSPYRMSNKHNAISQMLRTVQRRSIVKYLYQLLNVNTKSVKQSSSTMNDEIATFKLSLFDEFVTSYATTNTLTSEALVAFDQFLQALDKFFNLYEELTENQMENRNIFIKWYKSAIISSGDTIRAMSDWYNQAIFDNISININSDEIDKYDTCDGMCFGKVLMFCTVKISLINKEFDLALV